MIMAVVGGTVSEITGGKFANGAVTGAFVHLFNAEWRASVSTSGGAGVGGTIEKGLTLAHDSNKPWYKGWSFGYFKTNGVGAYTNVEVSTEINVGNSDNNHIDFLHGTSVTIGASGGTVVDTGYEVVISNTAALLHNYSLAVSTPTPVPFEIHVYKTETEVTCLLGCKK